MSTSYSLDKDEEIKPDEENKFRGMTNSLTYLSTSRSDIMFVVCLCAHFEANPKESHLTTIKRIMRHLTSAPQMRLWYPERTHYALVGYYDSDLAGCKLAKKCTSGTCHLLITNLFPSIVRNKQV